MAMVAHDPKAAKRLGISQGVGREFMKADKGRRFAAGGLSDLLGAGDGQGAAQAQPAAPNITVNVPQGAQGQSQEAVAAAPFQQAPAAAVAMKRGGRVYASKKVSSSGKKTGGKARGCGIATRGLTKGRMV